MAKQERRLVWTWKDGDVDMRVVAEMMYGRPASFAIELRGTDALGDSSWHLMERVHKPGDDTYSMWTILVALLDVADRLVNELTKGGKQ